MARNSHPFIRRLLQDYRQGRLAPLVGRCRECGDGYLVGDAWYGKGWHAYREPIGMVACPWCGTRQGLWAAFQACINGRCKRTIHLHLRSAALQGAVVLGAIER
jgi:hypothetical protein